MKIVEIYQTKEGRKPFEEWVDSLKDKRAQIIIATRIARIKVLLCGGDKKSQNKDIKIARSYWNDYLMRSQKNEKKGI
ncbi:MAG: hypothetical protein ACYDBV_09585 [Nitrospiria bacterium]